MYGKLCALKELSRLERIAEQEIEWSIRHPYARVQGLHTAEKALELYWSEMGGVHTENSHSHQSKNVVFSQDTNFKPGRPTAYFWKKSPRYEQGKHTNRTPNEEETECASHIQETVAEGPMKTDGPTVNGAPSHAVNGRRRQEEEEEEDDDDDDDDDDDRDCGGFLSDDEDLTDSGESEVQDDSLFASEDEASFIVFGDD